MLTIYFLFNIIYHKVIQNIILWFYYFRILLILWFYYFIILFYGFIILEY